MMLYTQEDIDRVIHDPTEYSVFDALGRNRKVKRNGVKTQFTPEMSREYLLCYHNVEYFAKKYVKIINLDKGIMKIEPYPYQEVMWRTFRENRFNVVLAARQSGKSIAYVVFILHQIIFNKNYRIALLANKAATSRQILGRVTLALENLPFFLQPGVKTLNKGSIEFETDSTVYAASTSKDAIRGDSINMVILDEFGFVDNDKEFMTSTYPVISSGQSTKIIIVSTANGIGNQFYKIWTGAINGTNDYKPTRVDWWEVPGRDAEWKRQTIANTSEEQFAQEFANEFVGAQNTLISANALMSLTKIRPSHIFEDDSLYVFEKPEEDNKYIITVDVGKGRGQDYSTFSVINISKNPYRVVARYRNNMISPLLYPTIIAKWGQIYNEALIVAEANDQGYLVISSLLYDLEYPNVFTESRQKNSLGVEMTKRVKSIGCTNLKDLIEQGKMLVVDEETIFEMTTFVQVKNSYEASKNNHDDLVMNLVMFSWFISTDFFVQYHEDARKLYEYLYIENKLDIEYSIPPFGIFDDGVNDFSAEDTEEEKINRLYEAFFNSRKEENGFDSHFGQFGILSFAN
jgi:hypothetical protein